jgi:hypothetical protein
MKQKKTTVSLKKAGELKRVRGLGNKTYYNVYLNRKLANTRSQPSIVSKWSSVEGQYLFYYGGRRFFSKRLAKDAIKFDVIDGNIEILNG